MTPGHQDEFQRRPRARARITALALAAMVLLFFAISIAKMS